ncbi:hypothetical protein PIB30_034155 [Stylosanthes scabra]|uniref:Uncharacterized protein n=1 Tax=Stylosanthes scabra TaxID=79078 RepID=A0ABU6XA86_9FABA|nr:hypothetical protein [Stylosanthes scabra]
MQRFLLGDSSSDLGHNSDYRDAQYFNLRPGHSFIIINDPSPVLDILTWLHPVTPFLNVPTPPARDKGFQLQQRESLPPSGRVTHHLGPHLSRFLLHRRLRNLLNHWPRSSRFDTSPAIVLSYAMSGFSAHLCALYYTKFSVAGNSFYFLSIVVTSLNEWRRGLRRRIWLGIARLTLSTRWQRRFLGKGAVMKVDRRFSMITHEGFR